MQLSEHLSLTEFTHSNTALKHKIDNTMPEELLPNAKRTAALFEVVREVLGRPCNLNSGYRNAELNPLVGGSKTSNHMQGCACDVRTSQSPHKSKEEQEKVKEYFLQHRNDIEFDQLILYWKNGQRFLHIGVSPNPNIKGRKEIGYKIPNGYMWL